MRMNFKTFIITALISTIFAISCVKDPKEPVNPNLPLSSEKGALFIVNEGLMNMNNSTITFYNFKDSITETDFFENRNSRKLGDTGNDIDIYGSKLYIIVNVSSQIEVLDKNTGNSIKRIPLFENEKPRQPRNIAFLNNKAFVSCFDGNVIVLDTNSLEIEKVIKVGRNPDGIAVVGNHLYVANSGGLSFPNYDTTVSVINMTSMEEIKKIPVGVNPCTLCADKYGDVYLINRGNYGTIKSSLSIISSKTNEVVHKFPDIEATNITINEDVAYIYYWNDKTGCNEIMALNIKDETIINKSFISDGTKITTPYGILVDKSNEDVFITDANKFVNVGSVLCFDKNGKFKYRFKAGLNPGAMAIDYR